jgi:hypothetical protein
MSELESAEIVEDSNEYVEDSPELEAQEETELESAEDEHHPAELAPDSEPGHEQKAEDNNINQEKVNEVIGKKHRMMKEAEERALRAEQQLAAMQQQQSQTAAPVVPDIPDPFDDNYDSLMREREAKIVERAQWDANQQALQQQQYQLQQQQLVQQQQKQQEQVTSYAERAKEYGISQQDLQASANNVAGFISADLTQHIIAEKEGPLITQYLGANPLELANVAEMPPLQAALYIERSIKPKLAGVKPKQTQAKKPPQRAQTSSPAAADSKHPHLGGARFE